MKSKQQAEAAPVGGQRPPPNAWITPDEEQLLKAAPALLEALKKCKAAVENGNLPPSARMEMVRDYATPTIAAAEGRVAE